MISPNLLNAALLAYVRTFPVDERLEEFLMSRGLKEHKRAIQTTLDQAVKSAEDFLWAQPNRVVWNVAFEDAQFNHIVQEHEWLSRDAFRSLVSFSKWFCWHEGLSDFSSSTN